MYYCPPPLESIIVYRTTEDEMTVSTGEFESETRSVSFQYVDNRHSASEKLNLFGFVCLENKSNETRNIRYRQAIPIRYGYTGPNNPPDPICIENDEAVVIWEAILSPSEEIELEMSWTLPLYKICDYNQDGVVDSEDLGVFLVDWNTDKERSDFNMDGTVNGTDLGFLLGQWTP